MNGQQSSVLFSVTFCLSPLSLSTSFSLNKINAVSALKIICYSRRFYAQGFFYDN